MAEPIQTDVDDFFKTVDDAATSIGALGQDIPLLGANLANVTPVPLTAFKAVQGKVDSALAGLAAGATADQIAAALNGAGVAGLTATVTGPDADQVVAIALQAADTEMVAEAGASLDLGVPVLNLTATVGFDGTLVSTLDTTLDYDVTQQTLTLDGAGAGALDFKLDVTVATAATASLGPLAVTVVTNNTSPATPQVALDISADLTGGGPAISVTNIAAMGGVNLDLGIKTSADTTLLPMIAADLKVGYTLGNASPAVALDDITVDLGGLVDELAQTIAPITKLFNETPFKQILKGLLGPVPIISDAAQLLPLLESCWTPCRTGATASSARSTWRAPISRSDWTRTARRSWRACGPSPARWRSSSN